MSIDLLTNIQKEITAKISNQNTYCNNPIVREDITINITVTHINIIWPIKNVIETEFNRRFVYFNVA